MRIVNAGRTGVERGAFQGAVTVGVPVTGACRRGAKDELGPLPSELATRLTPCTDRGMRAAVLRCLDMANAILLIVPHRREVARYPHLTWLLKRARAAHKTIRIHDDDTSITDTIAWALAEDRTLYVTGPRGTRWHAGESIGRRLIRAVRPSEAIA